MARILTHEAPQFYPVGDFLHRTRNFYLKRLAYAVPAETARPLLRVDAAGPDRYGALPRLLARLEALSADAWTDEDLAREVKAVGAELEAEENGKEGTAATGGKVEADGERGRRGTWSIRPRTNVARLTMSGQLRHALLGGLPGPAVVNVMEILGREITLARLRDRIAGVGVVEGGAEGQGVEQGPEKPLDEGVVKGAVEQPAGAGT